MHFCTITMLITTYHLHIVDVNVRFRCNACARSSFVASADFSFRSIRCNRMHIAPCFGQLRCIVRGIIGSALSECKLSPHLSDTSCGLFANDVQMIRRPIRWLVLGIGLFAHRLQTDYIVCQETPRGLGC